MARPKKTVVPAPAPAARTPEAAAAVRKAPAPLPSREELYKMIQTAAFFTAEKDAFRKDPSAYWGEAEKEIMARYR